MPDVATISNQVNRRLMQGSPVNPGLPKILAGLATAQTLHETGGYTSNVYNTDNNLIGYKWVGSRYQDRKGLPSPEGDNYGHYRDPLDSADELVDWIYRRKAEGVFPADLSSIKTAEQYAALLKKARYFGDDEGRYAAALRRWGGDYVVKGIAWGSVILAVLAIWAAINYKKFLR